MNDYADAWYRAQVKTLNDTLDSIYERQKHQAADGITPPIVRRDVNGERYEFVPASDHE